MNIEQLQNLPDAEKAKIFAAWHALAEVGDGMNIGIGSGSTASWFVKLLAGKQSRGLKFRACATSSQTTELAESLGIKIESLDDFEPVGDVNSLQSVYFLDLVIDGADEFDFEHNLIKGGGGALLQEKIVARSAERFVVITDKSKEVETLGKFPLPVEVVRFGWKTTEAELAWVMRVGGINPPEITQRMVGNKPFITDEGHYILDLHIGRIARTETDYVNERFKKIAGVVETGLFISMADAVIMADSDGLVESRETGEELCERTQYDLAEIADMLPKD